MTTLERSLKKRSPKIYLDYLQNRKGQTIASAYSVRLEKYATVSAPLEWSELQSGLKVTDFNIKSVPKRVQEKIDIFKGVLGKGIAMSKAIDRLMES